jgi:hypothetical protein
MWRGVRHTYSDDIKPLWSHARPRRHIERRVRKGPHPQLDNNRVCARQRLQEPSEESLLLGGDCRLILSHSSCHATSKCTVDLLIPCGVGSCWRRQ